MRQYNAFLYMRLVALQDYCWRTNKRKWAKALGEEIKALLIDFPQYRAY
jgi:hypothetical protein